MKMNSHLADKRVLLLHVTVASIEAQPASVTACHAIQRLNTVTSKPEARFIEDSMRSFGQETQQ